jgi:hypothetical protein
MSENTSNKNVRDDEIDLLDLFQRMGRTLNRWGHALGRIFLIATVFFFRRWLPLVLSVAAGIGLSYIQKTASPSLYTSDMIIRNNVVPNSELISYINRLKTYNTKTLSKALLLKPESFGNIFDISAFWIIDQKKDGIPDYVDYAYNYNVYDTVNIRMTDRLDIRVIIKTPQELNLVQNGILTYIESDSLFQQRNRLRLRQNHELLARLDIDILQLDSLQKVKYFEETRNRQPQKGAQIIFLQEQKTQLVYNDIYSLYYRRQALESERDLYSGIVTVLSDFSLPSRRDNGVLYYGKKIIPWFFCITLLILIFLANRKKLIELYKKY